MSSPLLESMESALLNQIIDIAARTQTQRNLTEADQGQLDKLWGEVTRVRAIQGKELMPGPVWMDVGGGYRRSILPPK